MNEKNRKTVALILLIGIIAILLLAACTSKDFERIVKPYAETAVKQGGEMALTEAAKLAATGAVALQTQADKAKDTAIPALGTKISEQLTPEPIATAAPPKPGEAATYTVVAGDTLTKIAKRFSLELNKLVELNESRFPSLKSDPNHVEVGWILIVSAAVRAPLLGPTPIPAVISNPPGCDHQTIYWVEDFGCEPARLDMVSEVGFNVGCIELDGNPFGYFMTHTIYEGWIITVNGNPFSYGWFVDKETNKVVIGPAVVTKETKYVECGIPGNP